MGNSIIEKVVEQLRAMPDNLQQEVLSFTQSLKVSKLVGVDGKTLLQFAGTISSEDLGMMREAIADDCEQVDLNEW